MGSLKGSATGRGTGAAALALAGHPPTVVISPLNPPSDAPADIPYEEIPEILLGADILTVKGDADDGQLIRCVEIPWLAIAKELQRNPDFLFQFDPMQRESVKQ